MKAERALTIIVITIALLVLSGIGLYADTGDDNDDTIPLHIQGHVGDIVFALNSNPDNNSCQDAQEIFFDEETSMRRTCRLEDMTFPSGNDVDDWYMYTTVINDCPLPEYPTSLNVSLYGEEDIERINVEVYDSCDGQPVAREQQTAPGDPTKRLLVEGINPDETYYIHVNVIDPPENGTLTYNLSVHERCWGVPE